nr:cytochrome P450 [Micromonospora sp. HK10]
MAHHPNHGRAGRHRRSRHRSRSRILLCPYLLHRDPRFWPEPERFDPDRWLGAEQPHARHAYLPFGAGPRFCPGYLLATVQLTIATRVLARDYRLELPPLSAVEASTNGLLMPKSVDAHLVTAGRLREPETSPRAGH